MALTLTGGSGMYPRSRGMASLLSSSPEMAAGGAALRTGQAFARAEDSAERDMTRMGINPASPRYVGLMKEARLRKAAASAGAATRAAADARDRAFNRMMTLANFARDGRFGTQRAEQGWGPTPSTVGRSMRSAGPIGIGEKPPGLIQMKPLAPPRTSFQLQRQIPAAPEAPQAPVPNYLSMRSRLMQGPSQTSMPRGETERAGSGIYLNGQRVPDDTRAPGIYLNGQNITAPAPQGERPSYLQSVPERYAAEQNRMRLELPGPSPAEGYSYIDQALGRFR